MYCYLKCVNITSFKVLVHIQVRLQGCTCAVYCCFFNEQMNSRPPPAAQAFNCPNETENRNGFSHVPTREGIA